jgi:arylsulfatase A-like enzyme
MIREIGRGLAVALWATLVLIAYDVARVPAASVPEEAGWAHLAGVVRIGLLFYGGMAAILALLIALALAAVRARPAPAGSLRSLAPYAGTAAAGIVVVALLGALSTGRGAPGWLSAPWLLNAQMILIGAAGVGWACARAVAALAASRRPRAKLGMLAALPLLPALVGLLPAVAAAGLPFSREAPPVAPGEPPDIFLIVADTLRADALSCNGARGLPTRETDRLAAGGVLFSDVTAQSSWTNPSTATILSGLMPAAHGMVGHRGRILPEVRMLAQILAGHGYDTAGLVANPVVSRSYGFARGFRHWDEETDPRPLARHGETFAARLLSASGWWRRREGTPPASEMVDRALEILAGERPRPLFLYLHLMDPHDPYEAPEELVREADPDYRGELAFGPTTLYEILRGQVAVEAADLRHAQALYGAEIAYMDREIGRFLEAIGDRLASGRALVLFTSDHGEEFMEHGSLGHERTLYQEVIHVPLILSRPGVLPAGVVVEEPVSHLDLVPSLLDLAGLPPEPSLPGRSLAGLARGETAVPAMEGPILSEEDFIGYRTTTHRLRAAREGMTKVILSSPNAFGIGPWGRETYDLAEDPLETHDLDGEAAGAERLEAHLREWITRTGTGAELPRELDPETERRLRALGYVE